MRLKEDTSTEWSEWEEKLSTSSTDALTNVLQDTVYEAVIESIIHTFNSSKSENNDRETLYKSLTDGLFNLGVFKESEV